MKHILQMAVVATTGMTAFSYALSYIFRENFREPDLLNRLMFPHKKEKRKNHPAGFLLHLGVGTFFSFFYYSFWKNSSMRPTPITSLASGLINGIPGIAGWQAVLKLHPDPPGVKRVAYYGQLLAAHAIFGLLNGAVYNKCVAGEEKKIVRGNSGFK